MFLSRDRVCLLLLCLQLFYTEDVSGGEFAKIYVRGRWRRIFSQINNSSSTVTVTSKWSYGLNTAETDETTIRVKRAVTVEGGICVSPGDVIRLIKVDINYNNDNEYANKAHSLSDIEIHRRAETTITFNIPPWTRYTRWQFIADIAGNEYRYEHTVNVVDNSVPLNPCVSTANIEIVSHSLTTTTASTTTTVSRQKIVFGVTFLLIKHRDTGLYLGVTAGQTYTYITSTPYYFVLHKAEGGVRIRSVTIPYSNYDYLYANGVGGYVYLYPYQNHQYEIWRITKQEPLHNGDIVSFRNHYYAKCFLSRNSANTYAYCFEGKDDKWILEVV